MVETPVPGIVVYTYTSCDSCRKAVKWLRENKITFVERPIRENPPMPAELRRALEHKEGEVRRLFNTSGQEYRAFGLSERLPGLSVSDAVALLAGNGRLVKRPFLSGPAFATAGFHEKEWKSLLGK